MECESIGDLLPWRLNGSLDGEEKRRVDAHLQTCEECRDALADSSFMGRALLDHPAVEDLVAYAAGEAPIAEGALVARHVAVCAACAEELELARASRRATPTEFPAISKVIPPTRVLPFNHAGVASVWRPAAMAACLGAMILGGGWWRAGWDEKRLVGDLVAVERRFEEAIHVAAKMAEESPPRGPRQRVALAPRERGGEASPTVIKVEGEHIVVEFEFDCTTTRPLVLFEGGEGNLVWAVHGSRVAPDLPRCRALFPAAKAEESGRLKVLSSGADASIEESEVFEVVFERP